MPSIRSFINSHTPIPVSPSGTEGYVLIEDRDLDELEDLAGFSIDSDSDADGQAEVSYEDLQKLANAAHGALHPHARATGQADDQKDGQEGRDEEDLQLRLSAMSFASAIIANKLTHSSGLDALEVTDQSVVSQAKAIYEFLTAG